MLVLRKKILIILLLLLLSFQGKCFSGEFDELYVEEKVSWDLTPDDLIREWLDDIHVLWFGKVVDISIVQQKNNKVEAKLIFAQHSFVSPGKQAIKGPFIVKKKSSGFFSFTLEFDEKIDEVKKLRFFRSARPYYAVTVARPIGVIVHKGKNTVEIEIRAMYGSENYEVKFIE